MDLLSVGELRVLPLYVIREPSQALRGPERRDPKYPEMRDFEHGVFMPILVRPEGDEFVLIDGMAHAEFESS